MTLWFYLTLLCNELFGCKWYAHSAFVWIWYFTGKDVLALSNSPDMNNRNSLKSFKDLPFYFTWAACFESGPCHKYSHVILNSPLSSGHLLKCSVLSLTSGYEDNWPLSLIFHKKINPSFSNKLILSPWQTMLSAVYS